MTCIIHGMNNQITTRDFAEVTMQSVVRRLRATTNLDASLAYPSFVAIRGAGGCDWNIGIANGPWGADWVSYDGGDSGSVQSTIPSDSTDVDAIVAWILQLTGRELLNPITGIGHRVTSAGVETHHQASERINAAETLDDKTALDQIAELLTDHDSNADAVDSIVLILGQTGRSTSGDSDGDDDGLTSCECDNTHQQNDTVCRWCWARGRRKWADADVEEGAVNR